MRNSKMSEKKFETNAIRTQCDESPHREHSAPIYMTSSFTFDDAEQARALFADEMPEIFTLFQPNNNEFIEKLCQMENCEDGLATASAWQQCLLHSQDCVNLAITSLLHARFLALLTKSSHKFSRVGASHILM